jgi:peptidoglycan/xylan/chitin deacetylase (PgdA/CDA1 family)
VLTYHRVLPDEVVAETPSHPAIVVSRTTFDMHVRSLARWFHPMSLDGFQNVLLSREPFAAGSCLVTFDDGWRDNLDQAIPSLEAHGIPATVFLVASLIGTPNRFWQERMTEQLRALGSRAAADPALRVRVAEDPRLAPMRVGLEAGRPVRRDEIAAVTSGLKDTPLEEIESFLATVTDWVGATGSATERDFLNWDEVRGMTARGATFGAHGLTHRILTGKGTDFVQEIEGSRRVLDRELGAAPEAFCYPNGDFNDDVAARVRDAGYRVAFSTRPGYVSADDNQYEICRINMHEDMTCTVPLFLARIAGLW